MVSRSHLNQALQILIEIRLRLEPDRFPRFVRLPESTGVEVVDAFEEVFFEIRFHDNSNSERSEESTEERRSRAYHESRCASADSSLRSEFNPNPVFPSAASRTSP